MRIFFNFILLFFIVSNPLQAQNRNPSLDDGVIRILAIGNSFSEDALEQNLYELAKARGKKIVIGNLYIGGAPLSLHVKNALGDSSAYSYRKITLNGDKEVVAKTKIATALADEPWDYVSFQQASSLSGNYETYSKDLPLLYEYVNKQLEHLGTHYILHQTWAYQQDSKHAGFARYQRSQAEMYRQIAETSAQVMQWGNFSLLIPAGTAIQNARTSYIGDQYTRDGYHLNLNYGRFTAACAWYEVLFNENVENNSYIPLYLTYVEGKIAKEAAHLAVKNPFGITPLSNYTLRVD